MQSNLAIANFCRTIARVITVLVVPMIVVYLLFVGLQLGSGEAGFAGLLVNIALLLLMTTGLVVAWRREALGAAIACAALAAFILLGLVLPGFRGLFSASPLVWPLSLCVAVVQPQSFDPVPMWIVVVSWLLLLVPIALFAASWFARRTGTPA